MNQMSQMKVINCPQCGGTTTVKGNDVYATCMYCGSKMYFKDNEVKILSDVIKVQGEEIQADIDGTKDAKNKLVSRWAVIIWSSLFYVATGFFITKAENISDPSYSISVVGCLFVGAISALLGTIGVTIRHTGYDVYNNKVSKGTKVKYGIMTFVLCKVFNIVALFAGYMVFAYILM